MGTTHILWTAIKHLAFRRAMARKQTIRDSSDEENSEDESKMSFDEDSDAGTDAQDSIIDDGEEDVDEDEEDEEEDEEEEEEDEEEEEADEEEAVQAPRMTARQRDRHNGTTANFGHIDIAELEGSNRPKKVVLSAEEQRIKRAEMARRRRNLSLQRLEEEKKETLDKLLKKRAKKMRGDEIDDSQKAVKSILLPPHPAMSSWTSTKNAYTLSVTTERAHKEFI